MPAAERRRMPRGPPGFGVDGVPILYHAQASLDQRSNALNRTLKEETVKRYYYKTHDQLRSHRADLRLGLQLRPSANDPGGLSPYEHICEAWTNSQTTSSPIRPSKCRD